MRGRRDPKGGGSPGGGPAWPDEASPAQSRAAKSPWMSSQRLSKASMLIWSSEGLGGVPICRNFPNCVCLSLLGLWRVALLMMRLLVVPAPAANLILLLLACFLLLTTLASLGFLALRGLCMVKSMPCTNL